MNQSSVIWRISAASVNSNLRLTLSEMFHRNLSRFPAVVFRLDGNEGVVGLSTHLTNLSRLMENGQGRWAKKHCKMFRSSRVVLLTASVSSVIV